MTKAKKKKTPPTLPAPKGENALSGKTYVDRDEKIMFSTTTNGATQAYTKKHTVYVYDEEAGGGDYEYKEDGTYKYVDIETGSYSWDEEANTVTLLPAKIARQDGDGKYGDPLDKEAWKAALRATAPAGITDGVISETTGGQYTTITAYINALADEAFKSVTNNYAFGDEEKTVLFLDEKLPANKGSNELSGKKYYGTSWNEAEQKDVKDTAQTYVFAEDGSTCKYTDTRYGGNYPQTYDYTYDSTAKMVYLKVPTEGRAARYTYVSENVTNEEEAAHFASEDEYHASLVNGEFGINTFRIYKYVPAEAEDGDNILERRN
jgi:hypothetical protein